VHTAKEVVELFCKEMYTNMESGHFMTLNYLRWNGTKHLLVFAGAGHEYILWFHGQTGRTDKIRVGGLAAGLAADCSQYIIQGELQVEKGDVVVLYTDGVTEAKNAGGEMFTLGRLRAALESYAYLLDSAKILELIMKDVNGFMAGCEQYDDITLMVLSVVS
jgi:phosphoserine phosphatase RsbU/P